MKTMKQLLAAVLVAALLLPLFPEKSIYAAGAAITDDNFLGTGQITLNVNDTGSGYDFTNALINPKTGSNHGGVGNMWELRLKGQTASCLNFGAPATRGNTYTQVGNAQSLGYFSSNSTIDADLRGLIYGYERLLGNHSKFGTSDPGYEKLSYSLRADGILTAADCYMMMQVLTWRLTCRQYCSPSVEYEKALAREIFCDLYGGDNTNWKLSYIEEAYGYLMQCINESRSGNYNNKYSKVTIYYYKADGESNQDLMIWDVWKQSVKILDIRKDGRVVGLPQPSAAYAVSYTSDMSYCFTQFTTNEKGKAWLELEEGTYYIKETTAPAGARLDNNIYTLTITDATSIYNLTDIEITNYLEFNKYEAGTSNLITDEAEFDLYEWNNGLNRYVRMGAIHYDGNGKYSLNAGVEGGYSYHDENGTVTQTLYTDKLYYTSVNEGKFRIVETKAPAGWRVTSKEFSMNPSQDGAVISMMTADTGIGEYPCVNALELEKVDTFTRELLGGAVFMVQEKVNGTWHDVGELEELTKTVDGEQVPYYRTTPNKTYSYHDADGNVYSTISGAFPLHSTTYNNGTFRVVERQAPEGYAGGWSRAFQVTSSDYHVISFTGDSAAENRGKSVAVKTAKYDTTTKEKVPVPGILTVYEHIEALDKWLEVGKLKFDTSTNEYVSDNVLFKFHEEDGSESGKIVDGSYLPGYLYYTSANQGRFKVKEEIAPFGYQLGALSGTGLNVRETELIISETTTDRETIDLTDYEHAARDTGIVVNVELSKFDALTREKLQGAVFTVQEQIGEDWLDVGVLAYDTETDTYTTRGMTMTLHDSDKKTVHTENSANGLYYTTANLGTYRVVETEAPNHYIKGDKPYSREFDITKTDNGIINLTGFEEAAKNIGIRAAVTVRKYDFATQELVKTGDTIFSVHEKIGDTWYKVGELQFNAATQKYESTGASFEFHGTDGSILDTTEAAGLESGYLYHTSANQGRFKVTELKAPIHYTLGLFSKEFSISEDNQEFSYIQYENAAKNLGISAMVNLQKYDVMTQEAVNETNAEFTIQEKIGEDWLDIGVMTYDETLQAYTSAGQKIVLHDSTGKEIFSNEAGSLYYTSANLGQFRVVETEAPDNYIPGSTRYAKEFNVISDSIQGIVDLTEYEKAAKNLGFSGKVKTAKYDAITEEKVLTGDTEFTIYEHIDAMDKWMAVGVLAYDEVSREYLCDNAMFTFHDEEGNMIDTTNIPDYENGVLYHTTANKGRYKVVETKAPEHYVLDAYEKEFVITGTGEDVIDLTAPDAAAHDTGVNGRIELVKADSITDERISGATFTVQEWSEKLQTWLNVGTLTDHGDGTYSTKDMKTALHTGKEAETAETNALTYTTQNLGQFRIVETEAPAGYLNDMYVSDVLSVEKEGTVIELTSDDLKATDTPIRVSISKKSITTGTDIRGAALTVKDLEGNVIDTWITDGCEHILSAIPAGTYILTEERAPEGYVIARSIEFEVQETTEIQKVEMFDEEVKGRLIINKEDNVTGAALAGAVFELKDKEGNVIQTLITDEKGHAESDLLDFGIYDTNGNYLGSRTYTLTEITAPNGYKLNGSPVTVEFQYQDDRTEVVEWNVTVQNEREPEVPTGDKTDLLPLIILMIFTALTISITIYCKKRDNI